MKGIGYFASFVFVAIYTTVFSGYALSSLWGWFIVSTLNVPAISVSQGIGVTLVAHFLTHQMRYTGEQKQTFGEVLATGLVFGTAKPLFAIATGWVVLQFM